MTGLSFILLLSAADAGDSLSQKMRPIYLKEASEYSLAVESAPKNVLVFKKEPVFEWSNPVRSGRQQGVVFLWLRDGRPAALGNIYSQPEDRPMGHRIIHEFHALDRHKLLVRRSKTALNEWKPQTGLERKEIPDAGAPAATAEARLAQMRRLAREFNGHSLTREGRRWELRLLPTPLYRYPSAKADVLDGALFTLVSNAGTDPEVVLLIEARQENGKRRWEYACCRFSDWELHVQYKNKEIFSSVPSEMNPFSHGPLHLFRVYPDKIVTLEGKLLARVRQTEKQPYGQVIPADEK